MKNLLKLFSLKGIAAILGIVYSVLQVRLFGATRTIEVFFVAQSLLYLVTSLAQSGQLAEIFLPEYHRLNKISKGLGLKALNVVLNRILVFAIALSILVFFITPYLIDLMIPGFSEVDKEEASQIFRVLLPIIFLQISNTFFNTVLNAEKRFGRAEFLGLSSVLINIVVLLVLYKGFGVWALVISLFLGKLVEFFFYLIQLVVKLGYKHNFIFHIKNFNHGLFFKALGNTFAYVGATQVYNVVLTASVSFLPEGTYAIFTYVQRLAARLRGVLIQPFLTIFFTEFSLLVNEGKFLNKTINKYIKSIIYVNITLIVSVIMLGDYGLEFLWKSKNFGIVEIKLSYIFFLFNTVAILIASIGGVYRKMVVSYGKGRLLYIYWSIAQLACSGLTYLIIKHFALHGLYFIIPLNVLFTATTSYILYLKVSKKGLINKLYNIAAIGLFFVIIASILKYSFDNIFYIKSELLQLTGVATLTIILISFPLYSIYKQFRDE